MSGPHRCGHCGYDETPEWASECHACGACTACGKVLPTLPDPVKTFDAREPHRATCPEVYR